MNPRARDSFCHWPKLTSTPFGQVGPQNVQGQNAIPKVSAQFDQQVQSNDFWSSLIFPFSGLQHSNVLFAHPLTFKAVSTGLEMGYTDTHVFAAADYLYPFSRQLTVGVAGRKASRTTTRSYGDWTVTAEWTSGVSDEEYAFWTKALAIRGAANRAVEEARREKAVGTSLEAKLLVHCADAALAHALEARSAEMKPFFEGLDDANADAAMRPLREVFHLA